MKKTIYIAVLFFCELILPACSGVGEYYDALREYAYQRDVINKYPYADGLNAVATFDRPGNMALDHQGNLYVIETRRDVIRKVDVHGEVTTVPQSVTTISRRTAAGTEMCFHAPVGIVVDSKDNLYITHYGYSVICRIATDGAVSVFAGPAGENQGRGFDDGDLQAAKFYNPGSIVADRNDNFYLACNYASTIRKISADGQVVTLAGKPKDRGYIDGPADQARFMHPAGIAVDQQGVIYISDTVNHMIRKLSLDGKVSSLAGAAGQEGHADGKGNKARFFRPRGIVVDYAGNIFVADSINHVIRKILPDGEVQTYAGQPGVSGYANGKTSQARFASPVDLVLAKDGSLLVSDAGNRLIRKISTGGMVTTYAGIYSASSKQ